MKMIPIVLLLALLFLVTDKSLSQSSMVFETGTTIEVTGSANICADVITIQGSYSGDGTQCNNAPLPVELISFTAFILEGKVTLNWETATEINNYGFEVERQPIPNPSQREGNNNIWQKIGFVQGHGNSNSPKSYSFTDASTPAGKVQYRLKQIDFDGKYEYSEEVEVFIELQANYSLNQNYPNPFNPSTIIRYGLPKESFVKITVYDIIGREIAVLVNGLQNAGYHEVTFDTQSVGGGLPTAIYLYKISAGDFIQVKKMIILK